MIFVERKCWIFNFKVGYSFFQDILYIYYTTISWPNDLLLDAEETTPCLFFSWLFFHPGHSYSNSAPSPHLLILWEIFGRIFSKKRHSLSSKYCEVSFHCFCIKLFVSSFYFPNETIWIHVHFIIMFRFFDSEIYIHEKRLMKLRTTMRWIFLKC